MNPQERLKAIVNHFGWLGTGGLRLEIHDIVDAPERYGNWLTEPGVIIVYIHPKLSGAARAFVLDHELFHVFDHETNWIKRELRANIYAARHNPQGFFIVLWKTITSGKRLAYYLRRARRGK